ncbi:MAG: hypothetical protein H0V82_01335 [Candidatus Protochlamydia sp.]|nr:hypothetical protein [Candidatus Protochlamydia sp.]
MKRDPKIPVDFFFELEVFAFPDPIFLAGVLEAVLFFAEEVVLTAAFLTGVFFTAELLAVLFVELFVELEVDFLTEPAFDAVLVAGRLAVLLEDVD